MWTPEPAAAAWAPEAATQSWAPELAGPAPEQPATWAPEQPTPEQPQQWTPEPEAWTSEPAQDWTSESAPAAEPETAPRAGATTDPLKQTLTAAIDILPQRTTIRTALRRGRRKGDPQPAGSLPFNGGFDPIAPAREFARREGFGSTPEVSGALPAEVTGTPATSGPVPEPSRSRDSVPVPVERRQHPRPGDQDGQEGRSALASEALTELSRLSSYSPTSMPTEQRAGLQRRTPSEVPVEEPQPAVESGGQRARTAASVRSMLAGFKAGVERGRTSPSANRPALTTLPRQPRNSSTEDS